MKHLFLPLICLLVSTPVLSVTDVSTPQPPTANQKVSIEDIRKIIPAEALPLITDKTLEYCKFIAETWPMLRGSEAETESEDFKTGTYITKTVTTPLMPGIYQITQNFSGSLEMQQQTIMCGKYAPISLHHTTTEKGKLSSAFISNIVAHEGQLFPLKIGNSERKSYQSNLATYGNDLKTPILGDSQTIYESVATVLDQINGYSSTSFPFPVNGKIWIIAEAFNQNLSASNEANVIAIGYYSEELNAYIPLNRPEDIQISKFSKSEKTISFKLLN